MSQSGSIRWCSAGLQSGVRVINPRERGFKYLVLALVGASEVADKSAKGALMTRKAKTLPG